MRKIFFSAFLFVSTLMVLSQTNASVGAPRDFSGEALATIDFVGAIPCNIDDSTSTRVVQCGSDGRNIVYGVIVTSITATRWIVLRDTDTPNVTSATATIVDADNEGADEGIGLTILHRFPVPLRFSNGISVNTPIAPDAGGTWTILYRPMSATE